MSLTERGVKIKDDDGVAVGYKSVNITAAAPTTTVLKSSAGFIHTITFNKPVATGVITIYNNSAASGTVLGIITIPANPQPFTLTYDIVCDTGITIKTETAAQDITVSYI